MLKIIKKFLFSILPKNKFFKYKKCDFVFLVHPRDAKEIKKNNDFLKYFPDFITSYIKKSKNKIIKKEKLFLESSSSASNITFVDVENRKRSLETMEAKEMLNSLPQNIKKSFIKHYLNPNKQPSKKILNYFLINSKIAKIIKRYPGSAEAFEYLYREKKISSFIDKYFIKCKAGKQVYQRLVSLNKNLPKYIKKLYKGKTVLIDNIGSGPGHDMIKVLLQNPNLINKVHIRNIDTDKSVLKIGEKIVEQNKLSSNFSFIDKPFHEVKSRKADLILLIGFLCPIKFETSKKILSKLICYSKSDGFIIFSTAQKKMEFDDPLIDYIMRFTGWNMSYKSDKEALDLARKSGWEPIEQFFDEPLHHHCMTVAKLK